MAAQEPVEVKPPAKPAPPVKATGSKTTTPGVKPATPTNRPAPPVKANSGGGSAKPVPQSSTTTRARRRSVVLPPNSRSTQRPTVRPAPPAAQKPSIRVVPQKRHPVYPAAPIERKKAVPVLPKNFTENITIQLQGSVNDGPPLDLSLTGVGPVFQADVVTGDNFTILSHQYSVVPASKGYKVEYNIGLRIRMEMSKTKQATSYEFRDVSVTGTVMATEGEKVVISRNGDRELALTLSKASKK